jgi:osmotically-inducible protein OsmY
MSIGSAVIELTEWREEGQMIIRRFLKPAAVCGLAMIFVLAIGPAFARGQGQTSDADVKARVEEKFKQSGLLVGNEIAVAVENKTVTLTGTVRTLAQKEEAGQEAMAAAKGYKVANNLSLVNAGLSARQMADGIMAAIDKSASYFVFDLVGVDVTAEGEVTLKGWTSFPWSEKEFVKLAQAQPGVTKVRNEILRPMISDAERILRNQVARLIYIRPTGPNFSRMNGHVHIMVNNGVVTLGGTVDKESDVENYERLVRNNTGALGVVNGLQVRKK